MKRFFGLDDLLLSEQEVVSSTRLGLAGVYEHFPKIIDLLFKLPYFIEKTEDPETEKGGFISYCYIHYAQAPYTFWSIYSLYEKGYYYEAIILLRHLLEALLQMKYFHKYLSKLKRHTLRKKPVSFKTMFDEFSKGFYEEHYGRQLSDAAHGMFLKNILRTVRRSPQEGRTIMGCEYSSRHASYVVNYTIALLYGYINLFPNFFSNKKIQEDEINYAAFVEAKEWLHRSMTQHKKQYPRSLDWYKHIDKLIY